MTKEEKKNEMKNRISMALKDPTLQQGFEIICEGNAELEENYEKRGGIIIELERQLRLQIHSDLEKELNPCFHCYAGAIGECRMVSNCPYHSDFDHIPDLESEYLK